MNYSEKELQTLPSVMTELKENGFQGGLTIVKDYISKHKKLVPPKRQLVVSQGSRGQRYHTAPGESYQMDRKQNCHNIKSKRLCNSINTNIYGVV